MKTLLLSTLLLLAIVIPAAAQKNKKRAEPGQRVVKAYTTDREKGGVVNAVITWKPIGNGLYKGTISGKYEDTQEDGYCVQAFRTGGKNRYQLGPPVCPKGQSFEFKESFAKAATAAVEVCRINNKLHKLANCSGWK